MHPEIKVRFIPAQDWRRPKAKAQSIHQHGRCAMGPRSAGHLERWALP